MAKRIFQYIKPNFMGDNVRWVAADTEAQADVEAKKRGWMPDEGEVFCLIGNQIPEEDLILAGCDALAFRLERAEE